MATTNEITFKKYIGTFILLELVAQREFFREICKQPEPEKAFLQHYRRLYRSVNDDQITEQVNSLFIPYSPDILERIEALIIETLMLIQN